MMGSRRWSAEGEKARKHEKDLIIDLTKRMEEADTKQLHMWQKTFAEAKVVEAQIAQKDVERKISSSRPPSAISPRDRKTPREAKGIPDLEVMSRFNSNVSATLEGARKEAAESEAATRKGAYETQRNWRRRSFRWALIERASSRTSRSPSRI